MRFFMFPVALRIGAITIYWYGVMAAIGFLLAIYVQKFTKEHAKMTDDDTSNVIFVAMIAGLIGARIFYVVQFFHLFRDNLWNVIRVDQGGLVFYGGFILATGCEYPAPMDDHFARVIIEEACTYGKY